MTADILEQARRELGLSHADLFFRYFGLGGMSSAMEVEAILCQMLEPTDHDRNLVATALNERYFELGRDHPVPYSDDEDPTTD